MEVILTPQIVRCVLYPLNPAQILIRLVVLVALEKNGPRYVPWFLQPCIRFRFEAREPSEILQQSTHFPSQRAALTTAANQATTDGYGV